MVPTTVKGRLVVRNAHNAYCLVSYPNVTYQHMLRR